MNRLELINQGSQKLRNQNIKSFRLDSEILLSKILDKKREDILINLNEKVEYDNILKFNRLINRRCTKEPIAYILNIKESIGKIATDSLNGQTILSFSIFKNGIPQNPRLWIYKM